MTSVSQQEMELRLVRYGDLIPCREAFLDRRIDGRSGNENFSIIGPGVAESADQHVHISIPHGFNVGGARQQPHAINSQHSHETAEVFIVQSGRWAFRTGVHAEDAEVLLGPGDTISIPTRVFRGFENISSETGFLFAVLGGDDPGRVMWAPEVFNKARQTGLVLLENGALIDTRRGEKIPAELAPMATTTQAQVDALRRISPAELEQCVQRADSLPIAEASTLMRMAGVLESPIIGADNPAEKVPTGKMNWPHGFSLRRWQFPPRSTIAMHARREVEVLIIHAGRLSVRWPEGRLELAAGDVLSLPPGLYRSVSNPSAERAICYVVYRGDLPRPPRFLSSRSAQSPS